jgi:hypothetical protein
METGKTVLEIKSPTALLELEEFDFFRTVPDYLHSVTEAFDSSILHLWTDKANQKDPRFLKKSKRLIIDTRLGQMKPPCDVTRTCRPLGEINLRKVSEFRSFGVVLLFSIRRAPSRCL